MAIYWPTPGFKGRTFKLCVLIRWDFNFCVRSSPLRGTGRGGGCKFTVVEVQDSPSAVSPRQRTLLWFITLLTWPVYSRLANSHVYLPRRGTADGEVKVRSACWESRSYREIRPGEVRWLLSVWNLGAVIRFHLSVSSLFLLPAPVAVSCLVLFSANGPFLLLFFFFCLQKIHQ